MEPVTDTFEYKGTRITVQRPNGFSRIRKWRLGQAVLDHPRLTPEIEQFADSLLYYLANTVKVEGDLGFPIVIDTPTPDDIMDFIEGIGYADEALTLTYDSVLYSLKVATNDPDLLPPDEIEKKDDPPPSKPKGDSSD